VKLQRIEIHQDFNTDIETIWATFSDHAALGRMLGVTMQRVVDSAEPGNPNGVGSVRRISALPLLSFEETVRKADKPNRIEYQITKGTPLREHYGTMIFSSKHPRVTTLDYTIVFGSRIPLVAPAIAGILSKRFESALRKYAASFA
jgi:hypothetical protein